MDHYRVFLQATGNTNGIDWDDEHYPIEKEVLFPTFRFSFRTEYGQQGDQPMVYVNWHGAQAMAKWLSDKTGKNFRLPTETKWEYAARSGGKQQKYAGGDDVNRVAWYEDNSGGRTHEVGTKAPNDLGIYDMSGNAWEWCRDWYSEDYYSRSPKDNPKGPSSGSNRVNRGGSWNNDPRFVRSSYRYHYVPDCTFNYLGFRLCLPQSGD